MVRRPAIGIDYGTTGAAACWYPDGTVDRLRFSRHTHREIYQWFSLRRGVPILAERVSARRGDYTNHLATFMRAVGRIESVVLLSHQLHDVPTVEPKTWQYEFGLGGKQYRGPDWDEDKEYAARKKAHHEYTMAILPGLKITRDEADAILIARYHYRQLNGELTHGKDGKQKRIGKGIDWQRFQAQDVPAMRDNRERDGASQKDFWI